MHENDRIVEINGFILPITQDYRLTRRNVKCYSDKLQTYITSNNLSKSNYQDVFKITKLIYNNTFDDIHIISVDGYY